jgi:hypothetical protein
MAYTLQLLTVVAVGFALACYGLAKGRRERQVDRLRGPAVASRLVREGYPCLPRRNKRR